MPLIYALTEEYYPHMVRGIIKCAKQTNTNLHTGQKGDVEVENFLWLRNKLNQTALNVAVENNHVDVAKLLLESASMERLMSERDQHGKNPISLLSYDPQHDEFIISVLEVAKRANVDHSTSTSVQIVDIQEETKVYTRITMDALSYPKSHKTKTRMSLEKLNDGKLEVTPNNNTILHLVSKYGGIEYVNDILKQHPSLLYSRNSQGETPAYVAAREGHMDILETMIHYFRLKNDDIESLVTRTIDNTTALHVAIQNHHVGVVFLLIKQIPQLANRINNSKESPIYVAVERSYIHILRFILDKCEQKAFEGPNGKTALHAAAISGSLECIKYLLSANRDLLYMADNRGWTPLHYVVYHNNPSTTKALLDADNSIGYEKTIEDGSLHHIALTQGNAKAMKVLISECPGCAEITNGKCRNILHLAIVNKKTEVVKFIFQDESLTYLINQKDNDGNTPIHLYMASDHEFDMIEKVMDSRIDINVLNNENHTPLDVESTTEKRQRLLQAVKMGTSGRVSSPNKSKSKLSKKEIEEAFNQAKDLLLVATLIATASFAAGFTVPGGFDGNEGSKQGLPMLLKQAAFQAFMVTNTVAFSCSCGSLFAYTLLISITRESMSKGDDLYLRRSLGLANLIGLLTTIAILAMSVAFATGTYVVLTPYPALAFSLCFLTIFITYGASMMYSMFSESSVVTYI